MEAPKDESKGRFSIGRFALALALSPAIGALMGTLVAVVIAERLIFNARYAGWGAVAGVVYFFIQCLGVEFSKRFRR